VPALDEIEKDESLDAEGEGAKEAGKDGKEAAKDEPQK
jgi:hypothetical protein